jgi:hypothetical protein
MAPSRGMAKRISSNARSRGVSYWVVAEDPHFTINVEADPLREGRYRWTICEGVQIHLRSPQSYATRREAKEDAEKAMSKFTAHWQNRY